MAGIQFYYMLLIEGPLIRGMVRGLKVPPNAPNGLDLNLVVSKIPFV
jgi:hypothetical protein